MVFLLVRGWMSGKIAPFFNDLSINFGVLFTKFHENNIVLRLGRGRIPTIPMIRNTEHRKFFQVWLLEKRNFICNFEDFRISPNFSVFDGKLMFDDLLSNSAYRMSHLY